MIGPVLIAYAERESFDGASVFRHGQHFPRFSGVYGALFHRGRGNWLPFRGTRPVGEEAQGDDLVRVQAHVCKYTMYG